MRFLPWAAAITSALLFALGLLLVWLNEPDNLISFGFLTLGFLAFPAVGAIIVSRQNGNPIGWIFCAVGVLIGIWFFGGQYAVYALVTAAGSLPGGVAAAWLAGPAGEAGWGLITTFVPLLFPTGRLLSPRWRPLAWCAAIVIALQMAAHVVLPGPFDLISFGGGHAPSAQNPTGIEALVGTNDLVWNVLQSLFLVVAVPCLASIVVRYRRAQGVERAQIRWFVYAVFLVPAVFSIVNLQPFQSSGDLLQVTTDLELFVTGIIFTLAIAAFPVAVGIAILRYRLWDIDIIIRRTLIYGLLTAALAAFYFGSVLVLESLLRPIVGENNDLAIVISTLLIAALFLPLRRAIQMAIDRRFYRRKYDAAMTLEAFSASLRDEVDLDNLTRRLLEVVDDAMQPASVSLWLGGQGAKRKT
jgi:hypothetical protein